MSEELLKFSNGKYNAKLQQIQGKIYSFSLLSGWSCPFASECLLKVTPKQEGGYTAIAGKDATHSCFSARQELAYPSVYAQRKHNFDLLRQFKKAEEMAVLIQKSLPADATIVRVHVGGDFFSKEYMKAWFLVGQNNPQITFYAYTKSIGYWIDLMDMLPTNFKMNASIGGKQDELIHKHNLKSVYVVYSEQEAKEKGLAIDHDDSLAFTQNKSFALLIHGIQPKGSKASAARAALQKAGKGQYSRKKIKNEMKKAA